MSYYVEPFTFHFDLNRIVADSGTIDVDCGYLYTAIKLAQASEEGIAYGQIAEGSGRVDLGPGVEVGLTVELLGDWQLQFAAGDYVARVGGGNLVGGPNGDAIAYSAGVQTLLIQSAASTVVTASGSVPTPAQNAAAVWSSLIESDLSATELMRIVLAVLAGRGAVPAGPGSFAFRDQADTKDRISGAVAPDGARTISAVDGS